MNSSRKNVNLSVSRANFERHWGDCDDCGLIDTSAQVASLPDGHPLKKGLCPAGQKLYDRAVSNGGIKPPKPPEPAPAPADPDAPGMKMLP